MSMVRSRRRQARSRRLFVPIWRMPRWKYPTPWRTGSQKDYGPGRRRRNPDAGPPDCRRGPGINEDVIVNVTLLGGGFGRKSKPDYVAEVARRARSVPRSDAGPARTTSARYYHAARCAAPRTALDQDGRANAWLHRTGDWRHSAGYRLRQRRAGQGADMPYDIPNVRCENGAVTKTMSALAGIAPSTTSRMPSRSARLSTSPPPRRAGPGRLCARLLGPPRLDLKALGVVVDYRITCVDQLLPKSPIST
jgi:isoquinoline 1-oxidoreductase beta subunit